ATRPECPPHGRIGAAESPRSRPPPRRNAWFGTASSRLPSAGHRREEATRRLATARLTLADEGEGGVILDALFASSGIESEIVSESEALEVLPDLRVRVATTGHLIALKILARDDRLRPQDRVDLVALIDVATPADIDQARTAIALIAQRRFHRSKDLAADLKQFLEARRLPGE